MEMRRDAALRTARPVEELFLATAPLQQEVHPGQLHQRWRRQWDHPEQLGQLWLRQWEERRRSRVTGQLGRNEEREPEFRFAEVRAVPGGARLCRVCRP